MYCSELQNPGPLESPVNFETNNGVALFLGGWGGKGFPMDPDKSETGILWILFVRADTENTERQRADGHPPLR